MLQVFPSISEMPKVNLVGDWQACSTCYLLYIIWALNNLLLVFFLLTKPSLWSFSFYASKKLDSLVRTSEWWEALLFPLISNFFFYCQCFQLSSIQDKTQSCSVNSFLSHLILPIILLFLKWLLEFLFFFSLFGI